MKRTLLLALLVFSPACGSNDTAPVGSGGASGAGGGGGGVRQPPATGGAGGSIGAGGSEGHGGSKGTGGGTAGGASGTSDPIRELCEAQCLRDETCSPQKFPTPADRDACVPKCVAASPSADTFRDGVVSSVTACGRNLACGANDDVCLVQAAEQLDPNWINSPDGKACLAKYRSCNASGFPVGYADESCSLFVIFSAKTLAAFGDCLAKPCPEVADCVDEVIPL